jgi:hypothetical protein
VPLQAVHTLIVTRHRQLSAACQECIHEPPHTHVSQLQPLVEVAQDPGGVQGDTDVDLQGQAGPHTTAMRQVQQSGKDLTRP